MLTPHSAQCFGEQILHHNELHPKPFAFPTSSHYHPTFPQPPALQLSRVTQCHN